MHDHAAIGTTNQATPALAARGQDELAQRRTRGETAEAKRKQRRKTAGTDKQRDDDRQRTTPCRPEQTLAQQLGAGFTPRQHRRNGHQEQQRDSERNGEPLEVRGAHLDGAVLQRFDNQREHSAKQHHKCEDGEHHVVRQEGAFAGQR